MDVPKKDARSALKEKLYNMRLGRKSKIIRDTKLNESFEKMGIDKATLDDAVKTLSKCSKAELETMSETFSESLGTHKAEILNMLTHARQNKNIPLPAITTRVDSASRDPRSSCDQKPTMPRPDQRLVRSLTSQENTVLEKLLTTN